MPFRGVETENFNFQFLAKSIACAIGFNKRGRSNIKVLKWRHPPPSDRPLAMSRNNRSEPFMRWLRARMQTACQTPLRRLASCLGA